ncbi:hypothetical protein [Bradyrhizobium sp. 613_E4_N2_2]|jgi:hypothetical protein|uniref:hypothetical protein n=1 Tax=unclassified Bradyrhizobium TaxID=2631580 RepID=UPI003F8AAA07
MTVATSASTEPEQQSSTLLAELERLSGQDVALARLLHHRDRHIGKLAEGFIAINWRRQVPEVIEPEEQHIIDLLCEYDAALAHEAQ